MAKLGLLIYLLGNPIAASILFPPNKNGIKSQLPPPPPFCSPKEMRKKNSPLFPFFPPPRF